MSLYDTFQPWIATKLYNFGVPDITLSGRVANQIVNCFLDRGCGETGEGWRTYPGIGLTVAPDDLLPRGGNTAYVTAEPMRTSGGYYGERDMCVRPDGTAYFATCSISRPPGDTGGVTWAGVATPSGVQSMNIPISYILVDPDSDWASVSVEYSVDDGTTWYGATPAMASTV